MRKLLIAAACTALLAACSQEPAASPASSAATPRADAATIEPQPAEPCPQVASPLPDGMAVDVPLHLAADRITTNANGKSRRVRTFEYLEGTEEEVMAQVKDSMAKAGFTEKDASNDLDIPVLVFQKAGIGAIHVAFPPMPEAGASHPSAKGRMAVNSPYQPESSAS